MSDSNTGNDKTSTSSGMLTFPEQPVEDSTWAQERPWGEVRIVAGREFAPDGTLQQAEVPHGEVPPALLRHIAREVRRAAAAGEDPSRISMAGILIAVAHELGLAGGLEDETLLSQARATLAAQYQVTHTEQGVTLFFQIPRQMSWEGPTPGVGWDVVLSEDYLAPILAQPADPEAARPSR